MESGAQMRKYKRRLALLLCGFMLLTACTPGTRPASGEAELPGGEKLIALTFDDGPRRETTEGLLDALKERGVPATFFLIGEQIEGNEDLIQRMQAEGHQIGNHTWSHAQLTEMDTEAMLEEVRRTELALTDILGEGEYWLRPPFGWLDETEEIQVPIVRWSIDPRDWESRDTDAVTEHVLSHAEPGAIILLHDIYPTSVAAALRIIDALRAEDYTFVTVEQLLRRSGIEPEPGESYRKA